LPILVTGSQGFVGAALRDVLASRGHAVVGVDLPGRGADIELDLGDEAFDPDALARRVGPVGGIIHLAARITRGSSVDAAARRNLRAIAEVPARLGEAWRTAHGPTHVVLCSSLKVYGDVPSPIDPLLSPLRPEPRSYGSAKALAERLLAIAARRAGFTAAFVRLTYVYGPGQHATNAIPIFLAACWRGEAPVVFGDGRELRDDVFVGDAAHCLAEACLRGAEGAFNAGGERARTVMEVATLCCDAVAAVGGPSGLHPVGDRARAGKPWIDQSFDTSRTIQALGYQPIPMFEGLKLAAAALRP
jgi:nucleoside-diphosphate-sugar epimerase